ncbi:MAG: hypothetical protein K0R25_577 [Rickettsiaceae bacterium]|jgi:hypothetical protein|nr:hypothetical protein [Rickettsiaceae bacterium]
MKINKIILASAILISVSAKAAVINSSQVSNQDDKFFITISGNVQAKPERILKLLTDYNNLTKLTPKIIESKILKKDGNIVTVKTITEGCVLFFCKKVTNTQKVIISNWTISSTTIAEESDLKSGKMKWEIKKEGNETHVIYSAELEPKFFVPPLIGTFFMKYAMIEEAEGFIKNVEKLAKEEN